MYSGALMSAKLRASQRAHKTHNVKSHSYQTPQYYEPNSTSVSMVFRAATTQSNLPTLTTGGEPCRNMSIFSGGTKNPLKSQSSPTGSMDGKGNNSLFPRRSQAKRQWSIQAVKGKVTTSCLWNACKALTFGTFLIIIGAGMATIGYYAEEDQIRRMSLNLTTVKANSTTNHRWPIHPPTSIKGNGGARPPPAKANSYNYDAKTEGELTRSGSEEDRFNSSDYGNGTKDSEAVILFPMGVRLPYEALGLTKLAYVGPIVMGVGGFVIVAACVMTFEARDSAAKIVPARFRKTIPDKALMREHDPRIRHMSAQTKWDTRQMYEDAGHKNGKDINRKALTSAFIRFSKTLQTSVDSTGEYYDQKGGQQLKKCPSAPSLVPEFQDGDKRHAEVEAPRILRVCAPRPQVRRLSTNVLPRQTMSVDNPALREVYTAALPPFIGEGRDGDGMDLGASATAVHQSEDEEANLAMDLHLPQCAVTLMVRDSSRSPSAKANIEEEVMSVSGSMMERKSISENYSPILKSIKVDKQTSTADGISCRERVHGCRGSTGGSFRESKRQKACRKVKRSETIDTASGHHKRHHGHHHHSHHLHSSRRSSSARSVSGRSSTEGRHKLVSAKSETGRKHQLLRQPKVESVGSQEDLKHHGPFNV